MKKLRHRDVTELAQGHTAHSGRVDIPPMYCKSPMVTVDRKGGSRGQGVPVLNSVSPFFNLVGQTLGLRGHVLS